MIGELTLSQIAHTYGGTIAHLDCSFSSVSTDSRVLENGRWDLKVSLLVIELRLE